MNKRKEILQKAIEIVNGEREYTYGGPEDSFSTIAKYWSTWLNYDVSATDVAIMMALLKVARLHSAPYHEDSIVDAAGYFACYYDIISKPE